MLIYLFRIGSWLALTLPVKLSYLIADILGSLYYFLVKNDRKAAIANTKVVLSSTDASFNLYQQSRMVFVNFARYLFEFFYSPKINLQYLRRHVQIDGIGNIDQALKLNKGLLLASAHLGNWELAAMYLAMLNYKVKVVAWTHKHKLVNDFFMQQRKNKGVGVIPLGTGIRGVFSALKRNEIVAVLADIDYTNPRGGIRVNFFGQSTMIPKGPAAFSLRLGCPIVPLFFHREKPGSFRFVFEKPIFYQPLGEYDQDLINLTKKLTEALERNIKLNPAQWFMRIPRWES